MALVKMKPTSPGRRGMVKVVNEDLYQGRPFAALVEKKSKSAGRNNNGHITTRHIGGGHKHHYRVIDFRRNKDGIGAKVERIEYDPNRSAHIALICNTDGKNKNIIASKGMTVKKQKKNSTETPNKTSKSLPIRNIPVGTTMHCVE